MFLVACIGYMLAWRWGSTADDLGLLRMDGYVRSKLMLFAHTELLCEHPRQGYDPWSPRYFELCSCYKTSATPRVGAAPYSPKSPFDMHFNCSRLEPLML